MYKGLKISASGEYVCATGNIEVLRTLRKLDGAKEGTTRGADGKLTGVAFIYFKPTRTSIMALESLCLPTSVTAEYITLRNETMRISIQDITLEVNSLLQRPMMQHQLEFVSFAITRRGTYNGSEQGTGKTMAACYLVEAWNAPINIVLCPSSLMLQWKDEFANLIHPAYAADNYNIIVLNQSSVDKRKEFLKFWYDSESGKQNIIITNYESLTKLKEDLKALIPTCNPYRNSNNRAKAVIIADEAWKIKNPKAKASIAARELSYWCDHVLALSGTPICQGVSDLWAQLDFITSCPNEQMESIELFCARYEVPSFTYLGSRKIPKPGPCSDPMGLMGRLGECFYRATKATSLDLPEKFPTERRMLEFPESTRRIYDAVERDGITALDPLRLDGGGNVSLRLRQICGGWILNTQSAEQQAMMDVAPEWNEITPIDTPKTDWIKSFCEDVLLPNPQMRVIVWFVFNAELLWNSEIIKNVIGERRVATIYGADKHSPEELEKIKDSFNSKDDEGIQVICGQISKLAFGHNLQGGDVNIYYSHTHRYVLKAQSADRTHRMGRVGGVRYIELCIAGSVEEDVLAATDNLHDFNARLAPDTTSQVEEM